MHSDVEVHGAQVQGSSAAQTRPPAVPPSGVTSAGGCTSSTSVPHPASQHARNKRFIQNSTPTTRAAVSNGRTVGTPLSWKNRAPPDTCT